MLHTCPYALALLYWWCQGAGGWRSNIENSLFSNVFCSNGGGGWGVRKLACALSRGEHIGGTDIINTNVQFSLCMFLVNSCHLLDSWWNYNQTRLRNSSIVESSCVVQSKTVLLKFSQNNALYTLSAWLCDSNSKLNANLGNETEGELHLSPT